MDSEEFEQLVVEALESLPEPFAAYLDNVEVIVSRRPSREQRRALGLKPWQTAYGMYEGVPYPERTSGMLVLPDTIVIFQEPLARDFPSAGELRDQVRRTVLHEIAHLFGISDERLRQLGAS
ncbi:MAG: metallopeptidase family protein [Chloroflexales bacterium]|nr:metallopeptidase family protein [Chloroflexales bacterium]